MKRDRVRRKLPALLCDGSTTVKKNKSDEEKREWAKRFKIECGLKRFRKRKPDRYNALENRLMSILEELEKGALEK